MSNHGRNVHAASVRRMNANRRAVAAERAFQAGVTAYEQPIGPARPGIFARVLQALGF